MRCDADDIAAVLHHRLTKTISRRPARSAQTSGRRSAPSLIAGLIPEATGPMHPDLDRALHERKHLIEQRARALAEQALANHEPWTRELGQPPRDPRAHQTWTEPVRTVAAYRDQYQITSPQTIGAASPTAENVSQRRADIRTRAAVLAARNISANDQLGNEASPTARPSRPEPRL